MRSAKRFFSGTMLSRVSGLLRDIAMAFAFGTQETLAAFLMAFRFAHLLRRLLGEGALQTAFIPQFENLRKDSPEKAGRFFVDLYGSLSILLTGLIALAMIVCGLVLWLGDLSPGNQEIIFLSLLMFPSLLFICLFGLNASLLQCEKNYFIPGVAPVAFNCAWIIGVFCVMHLPIAAAMPWLSGWIIIACLFQWLITVPQTMKILRSIGGIDWKKSVTIFSNDVRRLSHPLFLGIIGVGASQINNALDVLFARYASPEGPAYLWYAIRIQQLPLALFGIAISGALLPPLARAVKANELSKFRQLLEFALERSLLLMLPITAAIILLGGSSINLLYGHGDFHNESIIRTTECLWGYGLGLIPMALVLILAPAFYAQENYRVPTTASVISMALNIGLNALFVMGLGWGTASVAYATNISAWVNLAILVFALREYSGKILSFYFWDRIWLTVWATVIASVGLLGVEKFVTGSTQIWGIAMGTVQFPRGIAVQTVHCVGLSVLFLGVFCVVAKKTGRIGQLDKSD